MALTQFFTWISKRSEPALASASDYLLSADALHRALHRERLRADRNGQCFSLLTITSTTDRLSDSRWLRLAEILRERLRGTDEPGQLDERRAGIVLPETSPRGAWKLAAHLAQRCGDELGPLRWDVYAYPSDAKNGPESDGGEGDGQPDGPVRPLEPFFQQPLPSWKRALDIVGALGLLIVTSPLLAVTAALIKVTSPGPVFFTQRRAGLGGHPFTIYKFRTMRVGADAEKSMLRAQSEQDGPAFKMTQDPRVTAFGKFLRKSSIDELPQLFNVLRGNMSLVGPRPLPCDESKGCTSWQKRRLDVTPGITCVWQVLGRSRVTFAEWVRMDLDYVRQRSLLRDLKLLVATLPAVVLIRGAK